MAKRIHCPAKVEAKKAWRTLPAVLAPPKRS